MGRQRLPQIGSPDCAISVISTARISCSNSAGQNGSSSWLNRPRTGRHESRCHRRGVLDGGGGRSAGDQEIPIVFANHADPVSLGHVQSLPKPGGNTTGLTMLLTELVAK